jgi:hypothetical protein
MDSQVSRIAGKGYDPTQTNFIKDVGYLWNKVPQLKVIEVSKFILPRLIQLGVMKHHSCFL